MKAFGIVLPVSYMEDKGIEDVLAVSTSSQELTERYDGILIKGSYVLSEVNILTDKELSELHQRIEALEAERKEIEKRSFEGAIHRLFWGHASCSVDDCAVCNKAWRDYNDYQQKQKERAE